MKIRALIAALVLFGCGTSSSQVNGPNGEPGWYHVNCHTSQDNCLSEAHALCPNGYEGDVHGSDGLGLGRTSGLSYSGSMVFKCKSASAPAAMPPASPPAPPPSP